MPARQLSWVGAAAVLGAAVVLAAAGCSGGGFDLRCEVARSAPAAPPRRPGPQHGDYARMLPLRDYLRVRSVGADEHHFTLWYSCIEPSFVDVATSADGSTMRALRGAWGGLGVPPDSPAKPLPGAVEGLAERVQDFVIREHPDARLVRLDYHGRYREVTLVEYMPYDLPHAGERLGRTRTVIVRADARLRKVGGVVSAEMGGFGLICATTGDCDATPRWLPLEPGPGPFVETILGRVEEAGGEAGLGAAQSVLDEALAAVREERVVSIEALLARQGEELVPADRHARIAVGITFYARPTRPGVEQPTLEAAVPIDTAVLGSGSASGEALGSMLGITYRVAVEIAGAPIEPDARGEIKERRYDLAIRVEDSRGASRETTVRARGMGLAEGGRLALVGLSMEPNLDANRRGETDPKLHVQLPAPPGFSAVDGYVSTNAFMIDTQR